MSTFERVKVAHSPQDALLAIAQGIDALHSALTKPRLAFSPPTKDPWSGTFGSEWESGAVASIAEPDEPLRARIVKIREELESSDGEERRALEAELRLAVEQLDPPVQSLPDRDQERPILHYTEGGVMVDLPEADPETQDNRRAFAEKVLKLGQEFNEEIIDSYVKGGPLVLYYTDRDYVVGLPDDFKRAMIRDVMQFSPAEAHEMGRDLLKDVDADSNKAVTMEALSRG